MRRTVVGLSLLAVACGQPRDRGPELATTWLLAQQGDDGSFRSQLHDRLRAGHSTTALALTALMHAPRAQHRAVAAAIARALDFLGEHGVVPTDDDATVDYPTYTAACWLWTVGRLHPREHEATVERLTAFLRTRQLNEDAGWDEADLAYGGFDFGAVIGMKPRGGGEANLSTTAWVIQACRAAGMPSDDPLLRRARTFVLRCQVEAPRDALRHGGFLHSPVPSLTQSKAGFTDDGDARPRPYASATCDGLLALAALDERGTAEASAAAAWLVAHARVPDLALPDLADLTLSLRVYTLSALARASPLLPPDPARDEAIAAVWRERQQADGRVAGWSGLMLEDDPLIATCLALRGWPQAKEK